MGLRVGALGGAVAVLTGVFAVSIVFEVVGWLLVALAAAGSGVLAAMFAFLRPSTSWRWGLWTSCACSLFFLFVFFSYAANAQLEWAPLIDAALVSVVACLAAVAGASASRRRWSGG